MGNPHSTKDIELLKQMLDYDLTTGVFRWKTDRGKVSAGKMAGCINGRGYWQVRLFGRNYALHRVAFAMTYNRWANTCDHVNGNCLDNRIDNLREATRSQNNQNRGRFKSGTSGVKGVFWCKRTKKWFGRIGCNKKYFYSGFFETIAEASEAVARKRKELHGEFARD